MDQQILEPEQIEKLAKLPPKEQIMAQLAGAFEAPLSALATALEGKIGEMVGLLDALRVEREKEE